MCSGRESRPNRSKSLAEQRFTVTDKKPTHLRLHSESLDDATGDVATATSRRQKRKRSDRPDSDRSGTVDQFLEAYAEVTGWRIDGDDGLDGPSFDLLPATTMDAMTTAEDLESTPAVGRSSARRLAEAAAALAQQWADSGPTDVAPTSPSRQRNTSRTTAQLGESLAPEKPADHLEQILADAVAGANFDAAAIYLLDDDTTELRLHALFGLDPSRCDLPPRSLAECRGDLEALVKGVVTIDDIHAGPVDSWDCPEPEFTAAICATICAAEFPIGTLWLFGHQAMPITPSEAAVARLAASHIASELWPRVEDDQLETPTVYGLDGLPSAPEIEESDLSSSPSEAGVSPESDLAGSFGIEDLARWQFQSMPAGSHMAEGWFADGMIESNLAWARGWHHWDVLPDGQIAWLMAESHDPALSGAMTSTFAKAAAISHLGYRHEPADLVRRIGDSLWQMGVADQTCSLVYVQIDPETGEGQIAAAGDIGAIIGSRFGHRPLVSPDGRPLGVDFDPSCQHRMFCLQPGETLLAFNPTIGRLAEADRLGRQLCESIKQQPKRSLMGLRESIADRPLHDERSATMLVRDAGSHPNPIG